MTSLDINTISGADGDDLLTGTVAADSMLGAAGNDTMTSNEGTAADTLDGGEGNDTLEIRMAAAGGEAGTAMLLGGEGNDLLRFTAELSSANNLVLSGGNGSDTYEFLSVGNLQAVVVSDFQAGAGGDRIDLSTMLAASLGRGHTLAQGYTGGNAFDPAVGVFKLEQSGSDVLLKYDMDAAVGGGEMSTVLVLKDVALSALVAENFSNNLGGLFDLTGAAAVGQQRELAFGTPSDSGSAANDSLGGWGMGETINGGFGDDVLYDAHDADDQAGFYLDGGYGNDTLSGSFGNDTLVGGSGRDQLQGGRGNDALSTDGLDTVDGGSGDDVVIVQRDAAVQLQGSGTVTLGEGHDTVRLGGSGQLPQALVVTDFAAGAGGDRIDLDALVQELRDGGLGLNPFHASAGYLRLVDGTDGVELQFDSDGAAGAASFTTIMSLRGVSKAQLTKDNFYASAFADGLDPSGVGPMILKGTAGNDSLAGGDFNDTLGGNGGLDTLSGGKGDDEYQIHNVGTVIKEVAGQGTDTVKVYATSGVYKLALEVENAFLSADGNTGLTGNESNNYLVGNAGNNVLTGNGGNDQLSGGAGQDTLIGGTGNDLYVVDDAGDVVTEAAGAGYDTIYTTLTSYTMAANVEELHKTGQSGFTAVGNALDNMMLGGMGADSLSGGAGNDTLYSGAGRDTLLGGDGNDLLDVFVGPSSRELDGGTGTDELRLHCSLSDIAIVRLSATETQLTHIDTGSTYLVRNVETVHFNDQTLTMPVLLSHYASSGNDALLGTIGDDRLDGGDGIDTMSGGLGDDTYVVMQSGDMVVEKAAEGSDTVETSLASYTLGANVENLRFTGAQAFTGIGNALNNVIDGGLGVSKLDGGAGNDTLTGVGGSSLLQGGVGDDALIAHNNDTLDGGAGTDIAYLSGTREDYVVSRPNAVDTVLTHLVTGEHYLVRNVEAIHFDNSQYGIDAINAGLATSGNDNMPGTSGDDRIDGGAGADHLYGYAGNDVYVVDNVGDSITEYDGEGSDTMEVVASTAGTYVLAENVENGKVLSAKTVAINLTGNAQNNELIGNDASNILLGGAGNDTLNGGAGGDRLSGGDGNDVYIVDHAGDVVTELANGGNDDHVVSLLANYTLTANVESLSYEGSAAGFAGTGNALDNNIFGSSGNDTLVGLDGGDWLNASAGNDKLDGGNGGDHLEGGAGNDTLLGGAGDDFMEAGTGVDVVDGGTGSNSLLMTGALADYTITRLNALDVRLVNATTGEDLTVRNVSTFAFADGLHSWTDVIVNTITNGSDSLDGSSGSDRLDGQAGADTMRGLAGNDTYVVDNVGDVVLEEANGGKDTVEVAITSAMTYTLIDKVEHAKITSTAAINLTGNTADNNLLGNAAANMLRGLEGNDTLDGGAGADTLVGGVGNDLYVVDVASDTITELAGEGVDSVICYATSYTLSANVDVLRILDKDGQAPLNHSGTGNADANAIVGANGNDTLSGLAGDDVLDGGEGNDVLIGGDGNDVLVGGLGGDNLNGGAGNDTLVGGTGVDLIDGGLGDDTAVVSGNFSDYARTRPNATDTVLFNSATGERVTLRGVEHVVFASGTMDMADVQLGVTSVANDTLFGTDGDDRIDGNTGIDQMSGGLGNDTYVVDEVNDSVIEYSGVSGGVDTVEVKFTSAGKSYTLAPNVEHATVTGSVATNLIGNDGDNHLTGNAAANLLVGNDGADELKGMAGNDTMQGGAGDDTYWVDAAGDVVTENDGAGNDTVWTTLASYTLTANVERLMRDGTANFSGAGNALDNLLQGSSGNDSLSGGAGNDTLVGLAGKDVLDGGDGIDTVVLQGNFADYTVTRTSNTDTVLTLLATHESYTVRGVEKFQYLDDTRSLTDMLGNVPTAYNDVLTGTDAADSLSGGLGNDTLSGGAANDTLDGGAGNDSMVGGSGNDRYVVDAVGDVVVEDDSPSRDTVSTSLASYTLTTNVENLEFSTATAHSGIGNAAANQMTGSAGNDTLDGGAGYDYLVGGAGNDSLIGGAGGDMLEGGAGDDVLIGGADTDFFILRNGGGVDTIKDFVHGTDFLYLNPNEFKIGNGDTSLVVEQRAAKGGFDKASELVVFGQQLSTTITTASAAAAIGSANANYDVGDSVLFFVHNSTGGALFRFVSSGSDAVVSAAELTQLATLVGVHSFDGSDLTLDL